MTMRRTQKNRFESRGRAVTASRAQGSAMLRLLLAGAAATALTLGAAIGVAGQQVEQDKPAQGMAMGSVDLNTPVTVVVRNHNWLDQRVYLVHEGQRFRLGTVNSFNTEEFELPRGFQAISSPVQLLTRPIGAARTYFTPEIYAEPGDVLALELEENLNLSAFYVAGTIVASNNR